MYPNIESTVYFDTPLTIRVVNISSSIAAVYVQYSTYKERFHLKIVLLQHVIMKLCMDVFAIQAIQQQITQYMYYREGHNGVSTVNKENKN